MDSSMDKVGDELMQVLEDNEVTVADAVAVLELIKFEILVNFSAAGLPRGETIQ